MASDEFEPFVLLRSGGGRLDCALWKLPEGGMALAMFMSSESAEVYRAGLGLGDDWQVSRPSKRELLELLQGSLRAGTCYAVLDPDTQSASTRFDIAHVLKEFQAG